MQKIYSVLICTFFIVSLTACAAADPAPETGDDLRDISWTLVSLDKTPAIAENPVTLEFTDQDRFVGNSGCNQYSGSYELKGDTITIPPQIIATRRACIDQNVMDQEQRYFQILPTVTRLTLKGDSSLTLESTKGEKIEFRS